LGDQLAETYTLLNLGELAFDQEEWEQAQVYLQKALATAVALGAEGRILNVLGILAHTLAQAGNRELALTLLLFVTRHPACTHATRSNTADTLAELKADATLLTTAEEKAKGLDLETAVDWFS
jgi:tetratricopeptide (TPR) repeat protein